MNLAWRLEFSSASASHIGVKIPVVTISLSEAVLEEYLAGFEKFVKSKRKDFRLLGPYAEIASRGPFFLSTGKKSPKAKFNELHTAWTLEHEGFSCWGGVSWFEKDRKPVGGKNKTIANTKEIRSMKAWYAPIRWPSDIQATMKVVPTNPDIVAYSEDPEEWRFCEVKGPNESILPRQREGLAVLHLLTGGPVAFVRVVPESLSDTRLKHLYEPEPVQIAFRTDAELDWIHRDVRKNLRRKFNGLIEGLL
jgi:hypothetical protein